MLRIGHWWCSHLQKWSELEHWWSKMIWTLTSVQKWPLIVFTPAEDWISPKFLSSLICPSRHLIIAKQHHQHHHLPWFNTFLTDYVSTSNFLKGHGSARGRIRFLEGIWIPYSTSLVCRTKLVQSAHCRVKWLDLWLARFDLYSSQPPSRLY